jgi:hypothetical protein
MRAILMVLGTWVVMSVLVSLLIGAASKGLKAEAHRQARLAIMRGSYSTRVYGRSAPVRRLSA